jgi:hypothetical protein
MGQQGAFLANLTRIDMTLHNVIYISYALPEKELRPLVPHQLHLTKIGDSAFLSIVLLRSEAVRSYIMPFPRFTYEQINIRTYVTEPGSGKKAVYFLGSAVSSRLISAATKLIGLTWEYRKIRRREEIGNGKAGLIRIIGGWYSEFHMEVESLTHGKQGPSPFRDIEEAANYLIRPLMGCYGKPTALRKFRIWHPRVTPKMAKLIGFKFPLYKILGMDLGLDLSQPHSVFLVDSAEFNIFLPPIRVPG